MNREHIAAALAERASPAGISVLAMDLTDPERIPPAVDWLATIYNRATEIAGEPALCPVAASDGPEGTLTPPEPENATQTRECYKPHWDNQCCCNCSNLAVDLSHPLTDGGRLTEQRGWVCLAPEFDHEGRKAVVSGTAEHGLCGMWDPLPVDPEPENATWRVTVNGRPFGVARSGGGLTRHSGPTWLGDDDKPETIIEDDALIPTWRAPVWWEHESQTGGRRVHIDCMSPVQFSQTAGEPIPGGLVEYELGSYWAAEQARRGWVRA